MATGAERRVCTGEFRAVAHNGAGPHFTTAGMNEAGNAMVQRDSNGARGGYRISADQPPSR